MGQKSTDTANVLAPVQKMAAITRERTVEKKCHQRDKDGICQRSERPCPFFQRFKTI